MPYRRLNGSRKRTQTGTRVNSRRRKPPFNRGRERETRADNEQRTDYWRVYSPSHAHTHTMRTRTRHHYYWPMDRRHVLISFRDNVSAPTVDRRNDDDNQRRVLRVRARVTSVRNGDEEKTRLRVTRRFVLSPLSNRSRHTVTIGFVAYLHGISPTWQRHAEVHVSAETRFFPQYLPSRRAFRDDAAPCTGKFSSGMLRPFTRCPGLAS